MSLVVAFDNPHPLGIVCKPPCPHCGDEGTGEHATFADAKCNPVPIPPLFIIREVGRAAYVESVLANGGDTSIKLAPENCHYYEVHTD